MVSVIFAPLSQMAAMHSKLNSVHCFPQAHHVDLECSEARRSVAATVDDGVAVVFARTPSANLRTLISKCHVD